MTRRDRSDADLVAAARDGDPRAFAALVERHYGALLATCRRATADGELAADAAQEAVVTALVGLERLRDPERFGAGLIGIGLNLCRRALQERARWARSEAADTPAPGPGPQEAAEAAQIAERVRAAIAALPAGQRAAVALFHARGAPLPPRRAQPRRGGRAPRHSPRRGQDALAQGSRRPAPRARRRPSRGVRHAHPRAHVGRRRAPLRRSPRSPRRP